MIVESPENSITTDTHQKNLHPGYVIGKKIIPDTFLNAILQMDTTDISSLGLCHKVREISKRRELRTRQLS